MISTARQSLIFYLSSPFFSFIDFSSLSLSLSLSLPLPDVSQWAICQSANLLVQCSSSCPHSSFTGWKEGGRRRIYRTRAHLGPRPSLHSPSHRLGSRQSCRTDRYLYLRPVSPYPYSRHTGSGRSSSSPLALASFLAFSMSLSLPRIDTVFPNTYQYKLIRSSSLSKTPPPSPSLPPFPGKRKRGYRESRDLALALHVGVRGGGTWWGEKVGRCAFVGVIFDRSSRLDGGGNSTAGRRILQTRHTVT
jgi:hypothetical protein